MEMLAMYFVFTTLLISVHGKDYCHDQSASYKYEAVFSENRNWNRSKTRCKQKGGCLARPRDTASLKNVQNAIPKDTVHGQKIYWVGIKYDKSTRKFQWDDGSPVTETPEFSGITNRTEQLTTQIIRRCFAATMNKKLKAVRCSSTMKYMCQIPNTTSTSKTVNLSPTSQTGKSSSTPKGVRQSSTPKSVRPSSTPKSVRPSSTPESVRPSSTPESVRPSSTPESVRPSSTPESVRPSSTPESVRPSSTPKIVRPSSTPESVRPSSTPESVRPSSTPESVRPSSTPESVRPSSTPESVRPSSTPESVRPSSTPKIVRPSSTPESVRPSSTPESVRPSSTPESVRPSSTPESVRPSSTTKTKKPSAVPTKKMPTSRPKTSTDEMVDLYVKKMKSTKAKDRKSIEGVVNITTTLISKLKRAKKDKKGKKEKGDFMKGALQLDKFGLEYAKLHINETDNRPIKRNSEGLVLEMRKVFKKPEENLVFPDKTIAEDLNSNVTASIELPASLFKVGNESGIVMVSTLFTGVSDTLPTITENTELKYQLISDIISSTLDPKPEGVLPENVTITLKHVGMSQSSKHHPKCVFWEFKIDNAFNGSWSSVGCTVKYTNDNRTVCSCNHLTSFALLMQVDEEDTTVKQHKMALMYITYIGCSFSLIGEALTVLAYVLLMNMKHEQVQIRVNLAISLAIAQIFFLSGITATENQGVCTFTAVMIHFFYLVAFGWMMLEGVYLYLMVVKVFNTIIKMKLYYLFAWGFPLVVVVFSLIIASSLEEGIKSYTHNEFCWVSFSNGLVWTFVAPVLAIILVNMIILIRVVCELSRLNKAKAEETKTFKQGVKACVVLFPLLGLTWIFGILTVTDASLVFQYIFTILNSFQGFLIFIFHVLRSGEIQSSFKRKLQRWETTRGTNFISKSTTDHSASSIYDKNPLKQFTSSESLQDNLGRNNRITPVTT